MQTHAIFVIPQIAHVIDAVFVRERWCAPLDVAQAALAIQTRVWFLNFVAIVVDGATEERGCGGGGGVVGEELVDVDRGKVHAIERGGETDDAVLGEGDGEGVAEVRGVVAGDLGRGDGGRFSEPLAHNVPFAAFPMIFLHG